MNNFNQLLKNSLFHNYRLRIFEINKSIPLIQQIFVKSVSDTKLNLNSYFENDIVKSPNNSINQSDQFGTLKKSLESTFHYNSRLNRAKQTKIIIKGKNVNADDPNVFGNLSERKPMWYPDMYEDPIKDNYEDDDSVIVKNISKRFRRPEIYLEEMKRLVNEKKLKDALDLFVDMRRNFVRPLHPHYTFMIGACGKVGFTEMAFKLLKQMTERSYQPTPAVLTGLFNACAESPFPEYGLKKAKFLKEKIEMKTWQVNKITYHSMIKAFGKCGDLLTAFQIVDEMGKADIEIDVETFNFLLISCIANKDAGFTYAVEVWRKMKAKKCLPNIFTCNLFLRATRDCDIGPEEISCLLLQHWSSYSKRPYGFITKESLSKEPIPKLNSGQENIINEHSHSNENIKHGAEYENNVGNDSKFQENDNQKYELENISTKNTALQNSTNTVVSLLNSRPTSGPEILELVNIKLPNDRLNLIGGMEGFLDLMIKIKVKPNIKTFTMLLECIPSNIEAEEKLLSILGKQLVTPDVDFFNMLIKRRQLRKESESARNVLILLNKHGLAPNIMTFGVLSLGCRTLQQALNFLDEMKKFGSYPNLEIIGALLRCACYTFNYTYMRYVLKLMEKHEIKPNEKVLKLLEDTLRTARRNIVEKEQSREVNNFSNRKIAPVDFKEFCIFYEDWLKRMQFEYNMHPWAQYDTNIIDRRRGEENISN